MKLIVAVNNKGYIGFMGELMWRCKADLKHFKEKTVGDVVIMGRTTFEQCLRAKPLRDRFNLVLGKEYPLKTLFDLVHEAVLVSEEESCDVWVIGGESIYNQLVHLCDEIHISIIDDDQEGDAKFDIPANYRGKVFTYNFKPDEQNTNNITTP